MKYRFLTAVFGAKCSTFLLEGTVHHHCDLVVEEGIADSIFVEAFLSGLYCDDSFGGADSIKDGFRWYKLAKKVMLSA